LKQFNILSKVEILKQRVRDRIIRTLKSSQTLEELKNYFEKLTVDQQIEHNNLFKELAIQLNPVTDPEVESTDEEVLMQYEGSDVPYFTILKTSSQDSDNRPGSNFEEDLKD